jgi:hypothetical protein
MSSVTLSLSVNGCHGSAEVLSPTSLWGERYDWLPPHQSSGSRPCVDPTGSSEDLRLNLREVVMLN